MVKTTENPLSKTLMLCSLCAVFLFPYAFFTSDFFSFPFLFTSTILFLSIVFLVRITKRKERLDFDAIPDSKILLEVEEEEEEEDKLVLAETVAEDEASKESRTTTQSPSDSESSSTDDDDDDDSDTSENLDDSIWMMRNQNSEMSDEDEDEDEDEDGLIEITIPGVHSNFQAPKQNFPESIFRHQDLAELLAEINEENLIEIDISMGSIKCPRFEIEA